jgi:hypothetical protein
MHLPSLGCVRRIKPHGWTNLEVREGTVDDRGAYGACGPTTSAPRSPDQAFGMSFFGSRNGIAAD